MTMSSIGLPGLNGFVGEILILQGVFVAHRAVGGRRRVAASCSAPPTCCGSTSGRCSGRSRTRRTRRCPTCRRASSATLAAARRAGRVDRPVSRAVPGAPRADHGPRDHRGSNRGTRQRSRRCQAAAAGPRPPRARLPASPPSPPATTRLPPSRRRSRAADACRGFSGTDFFYLLPELLLSIGAMLVLGIELIARAGASARASTDRALAVVTLAIAGCGRRRPGAGRGRHTRRRRAGCWPSTASRCSSSVLFLVSAALTVLMSARYLSPSRESTPASTTSWCSAPRSA